MVNAAQSKKRAKVCYEVLNMLKNGKCGTEQKACQSVL